MTGSLLTGNAAAAWGARLADVDYIPAFPITPQTEIIELLAQWVAEACMPARFGDRPMAQGTAVLGGSVYSYFRYQQHLAQDNALAVYQEVAEAYHTHCGRAYGLVEPFQLDDAEYVMVMSNAFATKGKAAVQHLRARGVPAGLLRLRVLRPFPAAEIATALAGRKAVAVLDQNLAPGLGSITYQEIAAALYGLTIRPPLLSVIGGLGGKDISMGEFAAIFRDLQRAAAGERVSSPRLLYTQPEHARMQTLLTIAGKEVSA